MSTEAQTELDFEGGGEDRDTPLQLTGLCIILLGLSVKGKVQGLLDILKAPRDIWMHVMDVEQPLENTNPKPLVWSEDHSQLSWRDRLSKWLGT